VSDYKHWEEEKKGPTCTENKKKFKEMKKRMKPKKVMSRYNIIWRPMFGGRTMMKKMRGLGGETPSSTPASTHKNKTYDTDEVKEKEGKE